ncbi:MAG: hypothetical protein JNN15_20770 [Blastocatellia bacterium]|nr:hypothetical protein [Blastocatellia bacterium]
MPPRVGNSYAELLTTMQQMLAGLSSVPTDSKQVFYAEQIQEMLEALKQLDKEQENLKARMQIVSKNFQDNTQKSRELVARAISYLESEYGKTSPELQKYGISKRKTAGAKPSKTKPDAKTPN